MSNVLFLMLKVSEQAKVIVHILEGILIDKFKVIHNLVASLAAHSLAASLAAHSLAAS